MKARLCVLMLLAYAGPGAIIPAFSLRLQELGFGPWLIGLACAAQAAGSLLAPFVAGQTADRYFPAERCLAGFALVSGAAAFLIAGLTGPAAVLPATLAFWLVTVPTMTLCSAVTFTHLPKADRDFGRVRLWGTVGWILAGWGLGLWLTRSGGDLSDAFRLGGAIEIALAAYALTLPHTPPRAVAGPAPLAAFKLLRGRAFSAYALALFCVCLTMPVATQTTPLLLAERCVAREWLLPALTVAQATEVAALALLPVFLDRLRLRNTMLFGLAAWAAALVVLAVGRPPALVVASLGLNGFLIACFFVAGQVFAQRKAGPDVRASVQALLTCVNGVGQVAGNLLAGWVRHASGGEFGPTFALASGVAAAAVAVFALGFPKAEARPAVAVEPAR